MTDRTPQPATLEDVLGMIEALTSHPRMGRMWRKTALALSSVDLDKLTGVVVKGDVRVEAPALVQLDRDDAARRLAAETAALLALIWDGLNLEGVARFKPLRDALLDYEETVK